MPGLNRSIVLKGVALATGITAGEVTANLLRGQGLWLTLVGAAIVWLIIVSITIVLARVTSRGADRSR